jgi:hypothetical protein
VAVVFYNDHGLNFFLDKMPTFAVGAAASYDNADEGWGLPVYKSFTGHPELSWHHRGTRRVRVRHHHLPEDAGRPCVVDPLRAGLSRCAGLADPAGADRHQYRAVSAAVTEALPGAGPRGGQGAAFVDGANGFWWWARAAFRTSSMARAPGS